MSRRELSEKQVVQHSLARMAEEREAEEEEDASTDFDSWGDDESRCPHCFELMTEGSAHRCPPERD